MLRVAYWYLQIILDVVFYAHQVKEMLHTKYHEVEKLNTALNIKW